MNNINDEYLPRNEQARNAVLKAREIVKRNNQLIKTLKLNGELEIDESEEYTNEEIFSEEASYTFDLYKIKSNRSLSEIVRDLFSI
jgi:hypothetical protein